jgi:hypothetical protein
VSTAPTPALPKEMLLSIESDGIKNRIIDLSRSLIPMTRQTPRIKIGQPDETDMRFLDEIKKMPAADELPEDLSYRHDHYLYELPEKP